MSSLLSSPPASVLKHAKLNSKHSLDELPSKIMYLTANTAISALQGEIRSLKAELKNLKGEKLTWKARYEVQDNAIQECQAIIRKYETAFMKTNASPLSSLQDVVPPIEQQSIKKSQVTLPSIMTKSSPQAEGSRKKPLNKPAAVVPLHNQRFQVVEEQSDVIGSLSPWDSGAESREEGEKVDNFSVFSVMKHDERLKQKYDANHETPEKIRRAFVSDQRMPGRLMTKQQQQIPGVTKSSVGLFNNGSRLGMNKPEASQKYPIDVRNSMNNLERYQQENYHLGQMVLSIADREKHLHNIFHRDYQQQQGGISSKSQLQQHSQFELLKNNSAAVHSSPDLSYIRVAASRLKVIPSKEIKRRLQIKQAAGAQEIYT